MTAQTALTKKKIFPMAISMPSPLAYLIAPKLENLNPTAPG